MGYYTYSEFHLAVDVLCAIHDCSVTGGQRTRWRNDNLHNLGVGAHRGAVHSRHMRGYGGKASDLVPDENTPEKRADLIRDAKKIGFVALDEGDHVHVHDEP